MKNGKSAADRIELGKYIVEDPEICHGKPTFKGTRIMVWQVLDDVADGRSWGFICNERWGGRIPQAAIAGAVGLAHEALLERYGLVRVATLNRNSKMATLGTGSNVSDTRGASADLPRGYGHDVAGLQVDSAAGGNFTL